MKKQCGFTLLEAVVAMAIFAMSATAIYAWVNTNLKSLERVHYAQEKNAIQDSVIDFMRSVNPISNPKGKEIWGGTTIEWTAVPMKYSSDVLDDFGKKTINQATLYSATVTIYQNNQLINQFDMVLLGIVKVREMDEILFE